MYFTAVLPANCAEPACNFNFTMFKKECALKGYTGTYCLTPDDVTSPLCYDPMEFLLHTGPMLEQQLMKDLGKKKGLVFWMSLEVEMEKLDGTETTAHFTHKKKYIYNAGSTMEVMVQWIWGYHQESGGLSRTGVGMDGEKG